MAAQKGIELEVFFVFLFFYSSHPLSAPLVLCNTAFYSSISLTFSLLFSVGYVVSISLIYSAVSAFSTLVLSHVSSLRYSQKSWTLCSRFFLLPLAHISFLFTSSALLCFFFVSDVQIQSGEIFVHAKKVPWHQQYETQALERRKACSSLFLGTNNKATQLSIAQCEQRLVLHHNGCYRCSFLHPIIALNKEGELNRAQQC